MDEKDNREIMQKEKKPLFSQEPGSKKMRVTRRVIH